MTAHDVAPDPEALLIRMRVHTSFCHVVDPERQITWCGFFLSQGSERRQLSETPEDRRGGLCVSRLAQNVVGQGDRAKGETRSPERSKVYESHSVGARHSLID